MTAYQEHEAIIREAPRGLETKELDAEMATLDATIDALSDEVRDLADELIRQRSGVLRRRLQRLLVGKRKKQTHTPNTESRHAKKESSQHRALFHVNRAVRAVL